MEDKKIEKLPQDAVKNLPIDPQPIVTRDGLRIEIGRQLGRHLIEAERKEKNRRGIK